MLLSKKIFLCFISLLFVINFFSYWEDLANIYEKINKSYEKKSNESLDYAIQKTAQKYHTNPDVIKDILWWELNKCLEIKKFSNWKEINIEKARICYNSIITNVEENQGDYLLKDILQNTTKNLDIYANWNLDDSPYDLVTDIGNISKLLFKRNLLSKIKSWWKINMKQEKIKKEKNKNFDIDNVLQKISNLTNNTSKYLTQNQASNTKNLSNTNTSVSTNSTQNNNSNINTINQVNNQTQNKDNESKNKSFQNPNFQIWNICSQKNNNLTNNQNNNTSPNSIYQVKSREEIKKQFPSSFSTFVWWEKATFINSSNNNNNNFQNIFNWQNNSNWNNSSKNNLENKLKNWDPLCSVWNNKILAVCIKFIPSWPRWPVWGTIWADSIETEIDKIEDVLKDIRWHWIIPSAHGDEALDIDYKHIKFGDIFSFNIILTKKPVFKYASKDKKVKKTEKEPLSACPNIPWNLSNLYTQIWIKNCSSKQADINKYLLDISDIKENKQAKSWYMISGKIWLTNTDPYKWINKTENRYADLLELLTKWFNNLDDLLSSWKNASETLKQKSE